MAKTVARPMYEEFADTPYITHSRDMEGTAYDYLNNAIENLNRFNEQQYQAVADAYTQAQWNDLNRDYQQAVNANAARERNRLGTYGASSSLYNTENLQRNYNDMASKIAAQTAAQYQNLINNEYNRRLQNLNTYNNLWTDSGNRTYKHDYGNWQIRNINKDRQWLNEVDEKNNTGWNAIANVGKGIVQGISSGSSLGPYGAIAGGILGGIGGTATNQGDNTGSNIFSQVGNTIQDGYNALRNWYNTRNVNGADYTNYQNNQNWLANSGIGNTSLGVTNLQDLLKNNSLYQAWQ